MALYSETADVLGEYEAAVGSLADTHFVDIQPVLAWGVTNRMLTQRDIWLRTANYGTAPSASDEHWWLMGDTVTTPGDVHGMWIKGSGVHGGGRVLDDANGLAKTSPLGPGTRICRNDTGSGTPDLTWPFFSLKSGGDRLSNMFLRGVYDSDDITGSFPQPEVCIEIDKGTSVGTGKLSLHDLLIEYFDCGIDIGANSSANCDRIGIWNTGFINVDTAIRMNHIHVINVRVGPNIVTQGVDILVDCQEGGMTFFDNVEVLQDNLTVLKVSGNSPNTGQHNFHNLKFDNIGTNSLAVDMDTSSANIHNEFNFFGGKDSRILTTGDHTANLGRFHGNVVVNIFGMNGVGDIIVSGDRVSSGETQNALCAPFINLVACQFSGESTKRNPRTLLKKPNGDPAVEGVDYSGISYTGCVLHATVGSTFNGGSTTGPRGGISNYAHTSLTF